MLRYSICTALFLLGMLTVKAQTGEQPRQTKEMNVDMPDETEETDLVDKGQLQLETAVLFNEYKEQANSVVFQGMLRYGLSKRIEVRMIAEDGKNRDTYLEETVQSTSPLAVGTKIALLKDHGWLPDMTFVAYIKLPFTSRKREQQSYWSPIFLLAFQEKLGDKFKLEYNAGIQQEAFSADWVWLANASAHYKIADPFEIFVEYYAQYQPAEDPKHNLGGGLAYQINDMFEVYAACGSTIDHEDYNRFVSGGIALRVP